MRRRLSLVCVELVRHRAMSMAHWQLCLLDIFVGLLSKSEAVRKETLGRLHKVWVNLERAEMMRHKSEVVGQLLEIVPVSRQCSEHRAWAFDSELANSPPRVLLSHWGGVGHRTTEHVG